MSTLIIFGVLSLPIIFISWRTLFNTKSHGFYRFFAWECIAWLLASNFKWWFANPFSINQIISWILLLFSAYLVISGVILLKMKGKPSQTRDEENLFGFEKTTELIDTGVFRCIRHPLYASLIFLTWGIFLKHPQIILFIVSLLASILLYITSKLDEKECINYFGEKYIDYMKRTKMFIPYLF